jgi:tripartite-type tricarboxylate transporter receptor subunit TctC
MSTTRLAAAEDYPNRTIKIVVPAPPGPLLDVVHRIIAERREVNPL